MAKLIKATSLGLDAVWFNPTRPDISILMPSPLSQDPQCKVFIGQVILPVSQTEADRLLRLLNDEKE